MGLCPSHPTNLNRKGTSAIPQGSTVPTARIQAMGQQCSYSTAAEKVVLQSPHEHARSHLRGKQGLHRLPCLQSNYLMVRALLPASKTGQNSPKKKLFPSLGLSNISNTRATSSSKSHQKVVFLYPLLLIFTSHPNHTRGLKITNYGTWNKARGWTWHKIARSAFIPMPTERKRNDF